MALVVKDRVKETTSVTGTGTATLLGAATGYQSFSAIGNGNTTYYTIADQVGTNWEVGIGTYTSAGTTLSRDTVLASSNGGSLVSFTSGTKDVFVTQPADRSLLVQSAGSGLFSGATAFTANGVPYANSTTTITTGSSLTFTGTNLGLGVASPSVRIQALVSGSIGTFDGLQVSNGTATFRLGTTATSYSYAGVGANETWLYSASALTLGSDVNVPIKFIGNGSEQMRLDSTGLGIGTSSPSYKLHVSAASGIAAGFDRADGSSAIIDLRTSGTTRGYLGATTSVPFIVYNSAPTELMRLDSSGNLGIGLTPVASNGILQLSSYASVQALMEKATVSATAATGTINFDAATQPVLYYTTNSSANWTLNIRGNSGLTLNTMMQTGQSLTVAFIVTNGATAFYQSALTIDGTSVTPKWQGGTAPTSGNASATDAYVLTVIKTGSAAYTVLASQTKFA